MWRTVCVDMGLPGLHGTPPKRELWLISSHNTRCDDCPFLCQSSKVSVVQRKPHPLGCSAAASHDFFDDSKRPLHDPKFCYEYAHKRQSLPTAAERSVPWRFTVSVMPQHRPDLPPKLKMSVECPPLSCVALLRPSAAPALCEGFGSRYAILVVPGGVRSVPTRRA
jgi:hypothetical protein